MPRTGPCIPDDYRGIALTSVVYEAMCTVIKEQVVKVAEEIERGWCQESNVDSGRGDDAEISC